MRAPAEVRLEKLEKLIQRITDESQRGRIIIVEGTRDRESLRTLGIPGTILCLQSSRKSPLGFVEDLEPDGSVIILTDFDREGVFLAKRLARTLNYRKIHANLVLWRELRGLTRSDVRSIEELPKLHTRLRSDVFFGPHPSLRGLEIHYSEHKHTRRGKY
jgi:5S rRNA maturation endonuclease (ribonuclease M5)